MAYRLRMRAAIERVSRICGDVFWGRPHGAYGGRTPEEVYAGREAAAGHLERLVLFDNRLRWWCFS